MASPHSSAPSPDTSLPHIPAPQVDTQVTLPPVVLPTPPAFAPRLSITAQLTRPAYNFTGNNYSAWAYGFELFLESHNLHHHLMEDPRPLRDRSYASWSQSDSAIITWMLHRIEQNIAESLVRIKPVLSLWQTLETMFVNQMNIGRVVEIFETLLTLKQGDLSLQAHFGRMQALIQEVDLYQPPTTDLVTLKRYRAEHYASIYLSGLRPSIASQLRGSLLSGDHVPGITTIFSAALRVTTGMPSLPLSSAPGDAPPPSAMTVSAPPARDNGGLPLRFDGNRPPRGHGRNLFPPCPHYGKQNHPTKKCWTQFGKPPTAQAVLIPALPNIPAPQYHVTLTSAEYDALRRFASTNVSSSASLASLPVPSTSGTSALLASSSPSWIIDSGASSHMTTTSSLLSSYYPTPSHPPVTIADGRPCLVQGRGTTHVTPSLSLHQILYVPGFPVNLLSISAITRALPYKVTFFPSLYFPGSIYRMEDWFGP